MPRSNNQPKQQTQSNQTVPVSVPVPVPVPAPVSVIIVERNGDLRLSQINEYSPMELCKKCKCKSPTGFEMRAEWAYSGPDDDKFTVELWARENGQAGQENKYEFPPPVDTILFFGGCVLVAKDRTSHHRIIPLTLEKWEKMYNFLFSGFDTLTNDDDDDDDNDDDDCDDCDDCDSDALIHKNRKTKDGYLKDGFVVDDNIEDFETDYDEDSSTLTDDDDADDDDADDDADDDDADDDADDDDADDDDADDDDNLNDGICNKNILKQKCNHHTHAKNKIVSSGIKKRNPRHQLKEEIGPSFELVEETYEYFDD
jgi:hypothetical protein